jgi:hypothetical protein
MATKFPHLVSQSYTTSTTTSYSHRLSTSWLFPTWVFFAVRLLVSLYAFIVLFTRIGIQTTSEESQAAALSFSFFTVLGYWGLGFYFAFAAAHTASNAARGRAWLESWPRVLRFAHSGLYMTVTVFPWVVTGNVYRIGMCCRSHLTLVQPSSGPSSPKAPSAMS